MIEDSKKTVGFEVIPVPLIAAGKPLPHLRNH